MKRFCFLTLVLAATLPLVARAQSNPPFTNPSLDPNCYFPQIGVAGEIDTIVGDSANAGIGAYIHNLGPQQGGMLGNLLISNGNSVFEQAPTGSTFNLHDLKAKAQGYLNLDPQSIRFGHFHDQSHLDIFDEDAWITYWADDNGNYDTARKTKLITNIRGSYGIGFGIFTPAYIAHLTNDTFDDIVVGFSTFDSVQARDSLYLDLFKASSLQLKNTIAYEDTSLKMPPPYLYDNHLTMQGDFRGTGREDLLIADYYNNLFFYKNDTTFSLDNLLHAMLYDTLWTKPIQLDTNARVGGLFGISLSMHALPKSRVDNSFDWVDVIPTFDSGDAIFIFRGGPDFGSHRITLDSAAYVITPPDLGYQSWPGGFVDAGDMTGTGNHVLYTGGGAGGAAHYFDQNFYVTGQALDNKIDIFYGNSDAGGGDTLTANADSLEDLMLGNANYGDSTQGTMWLMYGSKSIPVHLNPKWAEVKTEVDQIPQRDGAGITFAPNPVTQSWSVATIVWPEAEDAEYAIYDMLGRRVDEGPIRILDGPSQQRIYFSNVPQGVYIYTIEGAHGSASAKIVKLSSASNGSGSSQPSIIQQMKQARDAGTVPETSAPELPR